MKKLMMILLWLPLCAYAQQQLEGTVVEANDKNQEIGIEGASVYWLDTSVGTITDFDGNFEIPYKDEYTRLVISYVGFRTDTIAVSGPEKIKHLSLIHI